MKHQTVLDNFGISFLGLNVLFAACPEQIADMLSRLAKIQQFMEMLILRGRVKAKKPGAIPVEKSGPVCQCRALYLCSIR